MIIIPVDAQKLGEKYQNIFYSYENLQKVKLSFQMFQITLPTVLVLFTFPKWLFLHFGH